MFEIRRRLPREEGQAGRKPMIVEKSSYRGSKKHKNRPAQGRKGTRCPEWTHATPTGSLATDLESHVWADTEAHALFAESEYAAEGGQKRYATARGIAFVAQATEDGTWHGYPEPWNKVPAALMNKWRAEKKVKPRDLKRYSDFPKTNINWALDTDDE